MLRYYAVATVLVLALLGLGLLLAPRAPTGGTGPPTPEGTGSPTPSRPGPQASDPLPDDAVARAPWALSALPECFEQETIVRGTPAFVREHVPGGLAAVAPGTVVATTDCSVRVYAESAIVRRGATLLFVPPLARIFTRGDRLLLVERDGERAQGRVYRAMSGSLELRTVGAPLRCPALSEGCLRAR